MVQATMCGFQRIDAYKFVCLLCPKKQNTVRKRVDRIELHVKAKHKQFVIKDDGGYQINKLGLFKIFTDELTNNRDIFCGFD